MDPLEEKYPNVSPYAYTFNNPLKYVDPTGKEGGEITAPPQWIKNIINWFNGNKNYKGSGWGHGLRTEIYEALELDDKAASLPEAGVLSMLQRDEVELVRVKL